MCTRIRAVLYKIVTWSGGWQVVYGVKPDEKKMFISKLQMDQNIVAMVGDGINDAAALASSDVGVAIGGGVEAASEVSSIVLMHNKLSQVLIISVWLRCWSFLCIFMLGSLDYI